MAVFLANSGMFLTHEYQVTGDRMARLTHIHIQHHRLTNRTLALLTILIIVGCSPFPVQQKVGLFWEDGDISFFSVRKIVEDHQISERERLFLMDEEGEQIAIVEETLPILTYRIAWSPDGERAAIVVYDKQANTSCLGIIHKEEFNCLDDDGRTASWSPDGQWLISHHKPINQTPPSLNLIEVSTGHKHQLIELPLFREDSYSTWSPDSRWIAYDIQTNEGLGEIWIVDLGGNTHFLTFGVQPAWSPLGNEIAFVRDGNIWIYDLDHQRERLVVEDPIHAGLPVWMSDGEFLLFESERDGNSEIYRVDKYGGDSSNLTNNPKEDFLPSVRPATTIK